MLPPFQDALNTFPSFLTSHFEHFKNIKVGPPRRAGHPHSTPPLIFRCGAWHGRVADVGSGTYLAEQWSPKFDGSTSGSRSWHPIPLYPHSVVALVIMSIAFPTVDRPSAAPVSPSMAAVLSPSEVIFSSSFGPIDPYPLHLKG